MIKGFEKQTEELNEEEIKLIPILINGFKKHSEKNPIKSDKIVLAMNEHLKTTNFKLKMTDARLRKCVNYIRSNAFLPIIATSNGYYTSFDKVVIEQQMESLRQRANSILNCVVGLEKFIETKKEPIQNKLF